MDISGSLFTNEYRDRRIAGKTAKKSPQKGVGSVRRELRQMAGPSGKGVGKPHLCCFQCFDATDTVNIGRPQSHSPNGSPQKPKEPQWSQATGTYLCALLSSETTLPVLHSASLNSWSRSEAARGVPHAAPVLQSSHQEGGAYRLLEGPRRPGGHFAQGCVQGRGQGPSQGGCLGRQAQPSQHRVQALLRAQRLAHRALPLLTQERPALEGGPAAVQAMQATWSA